jgi:hypothetical protein
MQAAYPGSPRRSEQLSCSKFFDPGYGLKDMIFQSFINFLELTGINLNSKLNWKMLRVPSSVYTECTQWLTSGPG